MKVSIPLPQLTLDWISELAESEGISSEQWCRARLRQVVEIHGRNVNILQSLESVMEGGRVFRWDDMLVEAPKFAPHEGNGKFELTIGKFLERRLPLCIAWIALTQSPDMRRDREWDDFESYCRIWLNGQAAEAFAAFENKEGRQEELDIYEGERAKHSQKPKETP